MIKRAIDEEFFENAVIESCGQCIIANAFTEIYPQIRVEVYPHKYLENAFINLSISVWDEVFHEPIRICRHLVLTQEQNDLAIRFDMGRNLVGEVIEITQEQIDFINTMIGREKP